MTATAGRRLRVAVVTNGYFPRIGGAERYHELTARALSAEAEVEVFTARTRRSEGFSPMPRRAEISGLWVNYLPWVSVGGERLLWPWSLTRALRRFRPDLLWANLPSPSAAIGARWMQRQGRPWIATFQGDLSQSTWTNRVYTRWEARALRSAAHTFVYTDRSAERLAGRGVDPGRIIIVPIGPLTAGGRPAPPFGSRLSEEATPGEGAPLLFVGALDRGHSYKGVDQLLRALAELGAGGSDVHLQLVGDGPSRSAYERVAGARGVSDRVRFTGHLSDAALAEAYRSAWCLVVPSTSGSEGFSAVAAEAAWYGCPTVISSAAASADFWRASGSALVYDGSDPRGLVDALRRIWSEPGLRFGLSSATGLVRERLDWDRLLPRTIEPIRRLLDTLRPVPRSP